MRNVNYLGSELIDLFELDRYLIEDAINTVARRSLMDKALFVVVETKSGEEIKAITTKGVLMVAYELNFHISFDKMYDILMKLKNPEPTKKEKTKQIVQVYSTYVLDKYIHECVIKREGTDKKASDIYNHYVKYCEIQKENPINQTVFGKLFSKRFKKTRKYDGVYYQDIRLKRN